MSVSISRLVLLVAIVVFFIAAFNGSLFGWDVQLVPLGLGLWAGAEVIGEVVEG